MKASKKYFPRYEENWAHKMSSWEYLSEDLSCQFSWSTERLISMGHPDPLGVSRVCGSNNTWLSPRGGRGHAPMAGSRFLLGRSMKRPSDILRSENRVFTQNHFGNSNWNQEGFCLILTTADQCNCLSEGLAGLEPFSSFEFLNWLSKTNTQN